MSDKTTEDKGPGIDGQMSGEGGIRPADAAVSTDKEALAVPGENLDSLQALDEATAQTLVSVTRAMYPHNHFPDKHYARVVVLLDAKAAENGEMKSLLTEGVAGLPDLTDGQDFAELDEERQVEALERIQDGAFFKAVAGEVVTGLYSQPDVWPYFGYEGPSNDKGGYIDRGFDDIDWLDDAPDYRDHAVKERVGTEDRIDREGA